MGSLERGLLGNGKGFNKAVYQEMLAALRPLTLSPLLNSDTAMILPDCDDDIMREMFVLFEVVSKAGGILRLRVLFPGVSVLIQDVTSDE